jgi:hypothetical protein
MRILVQPEQLRQNARILRQGSEFWRAQAARLRSLLAGLDWEIRQKANVGCPGPGGRPAGGTLGGPQRSERRVPGSRRSPL